MIEPQITVGLETSGLIGSVAALRNDEVLGMRTIGDSGRRHARTLISELDELLKSLAISPRSVGHVAVSVGPGSFTGLRVGVVAAKCWAFATRCHLSAVGTFEAVAAGLPVSARTAWVIDDALRGEVFVQRFDAAGDSWIANGSPAIVAFDAWLNQTTAADVVAGPAAGKWTGETEARRLVVADPRFHHATAALVAVCGRLRAHAGQFSDPFALAPLYIRRSAAEEKLDAQIAAGPLS